MRIKLLKINKKVTFKKIKFLISFLVIFGLFFSPLLPLAPYAYAAFSPAKEINYQGKLTLASGVAVTNTSYSIVFSLYTVATGGTAVWTETRSVATTNGLFSEMLGSGTALTSAIFNQTLYLGVKVGTDAEMTPRKKLGVVPAAFVSENAVNTEITDDTSTSDLVYPTWVSALTGFLPQKVSSSKLSFIPSLGFFNVLGSIGIGTTNPGNKLSVVGNVGIGTTANGYNNPAPANGMIVEGNVGIGTTAPSTSLQIQKNTTAGAVFQFTGTATDGSVDNTGGVGMVLTHNENGNRQFAIADTSSMAGVRFIGNSIDGWTNDARADLNIGTETNGAHVGPAVSNTQFSISNLGGTASKIVTEIKGAASQSGNYFNVSSSSGNGDIFTILSGGNVGIGTTGPGANNNLEIVSHNLQPTGTFHIASSYDANYWGEVYANYGNSNVAGFRSYGGNVIRTNFGGDVFAGKSDAVTILANGNVGIGTTAPGSALEINGQITITGGTPGLNKVLTSDAGGLGSWTALSGLSIGNADTVDSYHISGTTNYISKYTDATHLGNSSIFDNGNVGIGTTSPGAKLSVNGGSSDNSPQFTIDAERNVVGIKTWAQSMNSASLTSNYDALTIYSTGNSDNGVQRDVGKMKFGFNPVAGSLDSWISFETADNAVLSEAMRIITNGNVGIGTTAPQGKLTVTGVSAANNDSTGIFMITTGTGVNTDSKLNFGIHDGDYAWIQSVQPGSDARKLVLNPDGGNVGIGTTGPDTSLQVAGAIYSSNAASNSMGVGGTWAANNSNANFIGSGGYWALRTATNISYNLDVYNGGSPLTAMTVLTTGNVGIGTTNPLDKLVIDGIGAGMSIGNGVDKYTFKRNNSTGTMEMIGTQTTYSSFLFGTTAATNALYIKNDGNVGIGTVSPAGVLDVRPATASSGVGSSIILKAQKGAASNDGGNVLISSGDNGAGGYNGHIAFSIGGVITGTSFSAGESMRIDRSGNLGIGTTAPQALLDVSLTPAAINGVKDVAWFGAGSVAGNLRMQSYRDGSSQATRRFYLQAFQGDRATVSDLVLQNVGGNVGIGTTGPTAKLTVIGSFPQSFITDAIDTDANGVVLGNNGGNAVIGAHHWNGSSYSQWADLYINYWGAGTGIIVKGEGTGAGNVGIGTTAPTTKLNIPISTSGQGISLGLYDTMAPGGFTYFGQTGLDGTFNGGNLSSGDNGAAGMALVHTAGGTSNSTELAFVTHNSGVDSRERMRIDRTGNVGIGTTIPGAKLQVAGDNVWVSTSDYVTGTTGSLLNFGQAGRTGDTYSEIKALKTGATAWGNLVMQSGGGNVGIGTTEPGAKLEVSGGDIKLNGNVYNADFFVSGGPSDTFNASPWYGIGMSNLTLSGAGSTAVQVAGYYGINFATGNANSMVINQNGNVGIGTTVPDDLLHIHKDGGAYLNINDDSSDGTDVAPTYLGIKLTRNDINYAAIEGIITPSSHYGGGLRFTTRNNVADGLPVERMRIDYNGNVGIGTTGPGAKLHVINSDITWQQTGQYARMGNILAQRELEFGQIYTTGVDSYPYIQGRWATTYAQPMLINPYGGTVGIGYTNPGTTGALTINGNVGIGTTSPSDKLQVYDTTTDHTGINIFNNTFGNNQGNLFLYKTGSTYAVTDQRSSGLIESYNDLILSAAQGTGHTTPLIKFQTGRDGITGNTRMVINSTGNVGIGTTAPGAKLQVNSNSNPALSGVTNRNPGLVLMNSDVGSVVGNAVSIDFGTHLFNGLASIIARFDNEGAGYGSSLIFATEPTAGTAPVEAMRINQTGNVGIGTTGPSQKLDVNGSVNITEGNKYLYAGNEIALPSDENLVGYWPLDDGSGATVVDGSGHGNNGTANFTPTYSAGISGSGITFASGNQIALSTASSMGITGTSPRTVSLWFKKTSTSSPNISSRLFGWSNGSVSGSNFELWHYNDRLFLYAYGSDFWGPVVSSNVWYHVTIVFDGTSTSWYENGVLVAGPTAEPDWNTPDSTVYIGGRSYAGNIDEVRVYNKALTAAEIKALYLYPAGNKGQKINARQLAGDLIVDSNGNVGIGTNTPTNGKLTIAGDNSPLTDGFSQIQIVGATDNTKNFLIGFETTNNYMYLQGLDRGVDWGAYPLALQPIGGNVGIGMTNPQVALDVNGDIHSGVGGKIGGRWSTSDFIMYGYMTGGTAALPPLVLQGGGYTVNDAAQAILFRTAKVGTPDYPAMTILNGGNVGIGTTTPGEKLDVSGGYITVDNSYGYLMRDAAGITRYLIRYNGTSNNLLLGDPVTNGNVGIGTTAPWVKLDVNGDIGLPNDKNVFFGSTATYTGYFGIGYSSTMGGLNFLERGVADGRLFIKNGGNVGIGTTNPGAKLHVAGQIYGNLGLSPTNAITTLPITSEIPILTYKNGDAAGGMGTDGQGTTYLSSYFNVALRSQLGYLYLNTAGNVGIGTTTPGAKLDVVGNLKVSGDLNIDYGTEVYLSDVTYSSLYGTLHADPTYDTSHQGTTITLGGITYPKGVGEHAKAITWGGTVWDLSVPPLNKNSWFAAEIGIDDECPSADPVKFRVLDENNNVLYESAYLGASDAPVPVVVDIRNKTQIKLMVYAQADQGCSHSEWADARLIRNNKLITNGGLIVNSGNVGIGTANPQALTQISNASANTVTWPLMVQNSSHTADVSRGAGIKFKIANFETTNEINKWAGIAGVSTNAWSENVGLAFYTDFYSDNAPTEKMRILGNGNVGIGTTAPAALLDVSLTPTAIDGVKDVSWFGAGSVAGSLRMQSYRAGSDTSPRRFYLQAFQGDRATVSDLVLQNVGGNVGIGTTAPGQKLDVNGAINVAGNNLIYLNTNSSVWAPSNANVSGGSDLQLASYGGSGIRIQSNTGYVGIGTTVPGGKLDIQSTTGDQLRLSYAAGTYYWKLERDSNGIFNITNHNNTTDAVAFSILNTGSVGIGTTVPNAKLEVNGVLRVDRPTAPDTYLDTTIGDVSATFNGYDSDGWMDMHFQSNGNERMTILGSNGYVGIGTVAPLYKLDVKGITATSLMGEMAVGNSSGNGAVVGNTFYAGQIKKNYQRNTENCSGWTMNSGTCTTTTTTDNPSGVSGTVQNVVNISGFSWFPYRSDVVLPAGYTGSLTYSVWIKVISGTASEIKAFLYDDSSHTTHSTAYTATSSWVRYSWTFDNITISNPANSNLAGLGMNVNGTVYMWGNQWELGPVATVYEKNDDTLSPNTGYGMWASDFRLGGTPQNPNSMWDNTNNYLGIGTTNPGEKLGVVGNLVIEGTSGWNADQEWGAVRFGSATSSTATTGIIGQYGDPGLIFDVYKAGGNGKLGTDSLNAMSIMSTTGNVGIGTTVPGTKLDVVGSLNSYQTPDKVLLIERPYNVGNSNTSAASFNLSGIGVTTRLDIALLNAARTDTGTTDTNVMTLLSTGNVGIGMTNPGTLLHILKDVDAGVNLLTLENSSDASNITKTAGLLFKGVDSVGSHKDTARIVSIPADYNYIGAHLAFETKDSVDETVKERMRILNNGNVGIGTTAPGANLEIKNVATTGLTRVLQLGQTAYGANESGTYIDFAISSTGANGAQIGGIRELSGGSGSSALVFKTGTTTAPTEWMRINSSGNVGIGTTGPGTRLAIKANAADGQITLLNASSVAKAYIGLSISVGQMIPGSSVSDLTIRAENQKIMFSADAGTTAHMTILSNGNIGIGTTAPDDLLHIHKDGGAYLNINDDTGTGTDTVPTLGIKFTRNDINYAAIEGLITPSSHYGGGLRFTTRNNVADGLPVERMRIDYNGNVGIGTTAPFGGYQNLQVDGIASGLGAFFTANGATDTQAQFRGYINGVFEGSLFYTATQGVFSTNSLPIGLSTNAGYSNAVTLLTNGNVGIGTTKPNDKLDVVGRIRVTAPGAPADTDYYAYLNSNYSENNVFELGVGTHKLITTKAGYYFGDSLQLWTSDTPQMTIDTSGNVGIGTTGPGYKLDVSGTLKATTGTFTTGAGAGKILISDASGLGTWTTPTGLTSGVQIGTANLMRNSGRFTNVSGWGTNGSTYSVDTVVTYGGYNTLKIEGAGGIVNHTVMRLKANTTYTISALVKGSSDLNGSADTFLHVQSWTDENGSDVHQETSVSYDQAITTSWKMIYQTFTTPASATATYARVYLYPFTAGYTVNFAYIKLEQGNIYSDWTIPTDEITTLANITGTANYIPKFTGTNTIGNSLLDEYSGNVRNATSMFYAPIATDTLMAGSFGGSSFTLRNAVNEDFAIDLYNRTTSSSYNAITIKNNGGLVGIGTTGPAEKLSVYGGAISIENAASKAILSYVGQSGLGTPTGMEANDWLMTGGLNNDFIIGTQGNDTGEGLLVGKLVGATLTPQFLVDSLSGNVGIGTTVPLAKLEVKGTATYTSPTGGHYSGAQLVIGDLTNGGSPYESTGKRLDLGYDTTNNYAFINAGNYFPSGGNGPTALVLQPDGGNVGIGTTTPASTLTVLSTITTGAAVSITANSLTSGTILNLDGAIYGVLDGEKGLNISLSAPGATGTSYGAYIENIHSTSGTAVNVALYATASSGTSNYAAIFDAGNVKIGTLAGNGNRAVYSDANGVLTNSTSDARLKKDVVTISKEIDVIASLNKLRGVYYNWDTSIDAAKNLGSQREIGMIAQEVELVLPELVGTNATGYKSLDYPKMTGFLIEVTKIQQAEIEAMNLKLGALTGEIIPTVGSEEETFMNNFFANLFVKVENWLARADNGIKVIFARKINTKLLCIADEAGVKTCVEKTQLDNLLAKAGEVSASETNDVGGIFTDELAVSVNPNAPVITLNGDATINLGIGDVYEELGANAVDDKDDFVAVSVTGVPDTSTNGIYDIHYNAVDSDGNNATKLIRKVIVGTGDYTLTGVSGEWVPSDTASTIKPSTPDTTTTIVTPISTTTVSTELGSGGVTSPIAPVAPVVPVVPVTPVVSTTPVTTETTTITTPESTTTVPTIWSSIPVTAPATEEVAPVVAAPVAPVTAPVIETVAPVIETTPTITP